MSSAVSTRRFFFFVRATTTGAATRKIFFNSVAGKMGLPWQATSRALALERGGGNVGPMATAALAAPGGARHQGRRISWQPLPGSGGSWPDFESAHRVTSPSSSTRHQPLLQERFPAWAAQDRTLARGRRSRSPATAHRERESRGGLVARLLGGGERPPRPRCPKSAKPRSNKGTQESTDAARVGRETAGSGEAGKGVTVVFDLHLDEAKLNELGRYTQESLQELAAR